MPRCYLLAVSSGSSLDQHSNNVTLFNLVEQLNIPPNAPPPPGGFLPLELHAYFDIAPTEMSQTFQVRIAMVGESGLETYTEPFDFKSATPRFRTRSLGLPIPSVNGMYQVRVDVRREGTGEWRRDSAAWPIALVEHTPRPTVTH
ncbi:MAG: hypothetical protein IPI67_34900 [Myxococcales bacterium]|nr:hypothetical protein [Myxococcales bacterium]